MARQRVDAWTVPRFVPAAARCFSTLARRSVQPGRLLICRSGSVIRAEVARHAGAEGTLFFGGEATDSEQTGTVAGAIASGRRAAHQLLRALQT